LAVIGTRLANRYELIRELGRGGMGSVWLARDPLLDREVAIKLVRPSSLAPDIAERFRREARLVAKMDHPAIVVAHDIGEHEGWNFFVMPLVAGTSLRQLLGDLTLRLEDVVDIGIGVAEALDYSHSRGVFHCDIKPENIMVERETERGTRVRILDFGISRSVSDERLTESGAIVGTAFYLSPEQVEGGAIDGRTDLYSLGVVLYECVVGRPPFTGDAQSVLYRTVHEIPPSPSSLGATIDAELERILLDCLEKKPERRPADARELARRLAAWAGSLSDGEKSRTLVSVESGALPRRRSPPASFVGRERELETLQRLLGEAVAGESRLVLVSGEPGIGKSRLLEEIERLAAARRIPVLHGRFVERDRSFSYQGFCDALGEWFRSRPHDDSVPAVDFSDLAGDLAILFPALAEIEEIRGSTSGLLRSEPPPSTDRSWVFELVSRAFARICGGRPLVLLFEDLHAADLSIEAIAWLARRLAASPVLVLATFRQTEVDRHHPLVRMIESFEGDKRYSGIFLGPLSFPEQCELVRGLLGGGEPGEQLLSRLFEAAEGNPFFTKELVRSLVDSGTLVRDEGNDWILPGGAALGTLALPATIAQTVARRVDRLDAPLRELLALASVLGRSFDLRDLEELATGGEELPGEIDRLIEAELLVEERESRGDRIAFSSAIVREVLYESLPRRRRRSLHHRFAELLERRNSGRLERVLPELVHHYSQGDDTAKVVELGFKLARKALSSHLPEEAERAARAVLAALADDPESSPRLAGDARSLLASALRMLGDVDSALREIEEAIRIYEEGGEIAPAASALVRAAEIAWQGRRVEDAERWIERGLVFARKGGESDELRRLLSLAATVANLKGDSARARELAAEAERISAAGRTEDEIPRGGRLVVALSQPIIATDPAAIRVNEETEVLGCVFETLVDMDAAGNPTPALCDHWEVLGGGRSFRFFLRPTIRWHDGAPLRAADVAASIERTALQSTTGLPAAFAAIRGIGDFIEGRTERIAGLRVEGELGFLVELHEPLPIYPALLTDPRTALSAGRPSGSWAGRSVGTGPFAVQSFDDRRIVLARNPAYWRRHAARLDSIEFRHRMSSGEIAARFRFGEVDLARDLLPETLEELLRDRRLRPSIVEAPKKNVYFVLFSRSGKGARMRELREAMCGVTRVQDIVRASLGRLAQPATGLIPPGVLGHDPGRRRKYEPTERARERIASLGQEGPIRLAAAVHPALVDRYSSLASALFESWRAIGVEVEMATSGMADFLSRYERPEGIDLLIGRWVADYEDPDSFTWGLFHSRMGELRQHYSSLELDDAIEEARVESRPAMRERLYRKIETELVDGAWLLPLFHDIDYRVASPRVRGLSLRSRPPYVNYAEVGREESPRPASAPRQRGGELRVPLLGILESLDPARTTLSVQSEVLPEVFETLTRESEDARIAPHLAAELRAEDGGRRFVVRLRDDVLFHDGRRLGARDVRWSFERLLADEGSSVRWPLAGILGAKAIQEGRSRELEGIRIVTPTELVIELEEPVSFFPALLAYPSTAIVPEGSDPGSPSDRPVGSGPFRVVRFDPGHRLELEANDSYWRRGLPRADSLVFEFGVPPRRIEAGFRAAEFDVAGDLLPEAVEALRHEPSFASGYRETPRLATYVIVMNCRGGALVDEALRLRLCRALPAAALVRRHVGRLGIPARGLIPPGLLGWEPAPPESSQDLSPVRPLVPPVELRATVHSVYEGPFARLFEALLGSLREAGFAVRIVESGEEYQIVGETPEIDLCFTRWIADYPDADTFIHGLLHSRRGLFAPFCGLPEIDRLIEWGRASTEPSARHSIYREIEEIVRQRAMLLPLFHEQAYRFFRPEVEGFEIGMSDPIVTYEKLSVRR
jgi:ABC-type transport system substrate-binding protein